MFNRKPSDDSSKLDGVIDDALDTLNDYDPTDERYATTVAQLEKLYKFKNDNRSGRVSPDTLAMVVGNLAGILVIVGHERAHIVTSKALSFVMKAAR